MYIRHKTIVLLLLLLRWLARVAKVASWASE